MAGPGTEARQGAGRRRSTAHSSPPPGRPGACGPVPSALDLRQRGVAQQQPLLRPGGVEGDGRDGLVPRARDGVHTPLAEGRVGDAVTRAERHDLLLRLHPARRLPAHHGGGHRQVRRLVPAGEALGPRAVVVPGPPGRSPAAEPPRVARGAGAGQAQRAGRARGALPLPVDERLRDLPEELAGRVELVLAPQRACLGARQEQATAGARQAHVGQTALLRELLLVRHRAGVREHPVLHARQEHHGELEALGGVQRHERDLALLLGERLALHVRGRGQLVRVRHERHLLEEVGQGAVRVRRLEGADDGDELAEVVRAGLVLQVLGLAEGGQHPGLLEDGLQDGGRAGGLGDLAEVVHHLHEAADGLERARGHAGGVLGVAQGRGERGAVALGPRGDGALGPVPDAPLGLVEDAAHVDVVVGVDDHPQVGERVLDLLAVVEARAADDPVRDAARHQPLLERTGLRVGPVEHGDVGRADPVLVLQPVDGGGDPLRLGGLVLRGVADDRGALPLGRPQALGTAVRVALDHRVGGVQDGLRGAVVLLELDGDGVREVLLELDDVADVRAAERVDGLVRVADDGQLAAGGLHALGVARRAGEEPDQAVLCVVGVLVLVHEDVAEPAAVVVQHARERLEHVDRHADQVVEVQGVGLAQAGRVVPVDGGDGAAPRVPLGHGGGVVVRLHELVLQGADAVQQGLGREALRVQLVLLGDGGDQAQAVRRVVDGERGLQPDVGGLVAQQPHGGGMERGDPHPLGGGTDQTGHALAHLRGGLVREGDGEDLVRPRPSGGEQPRDAVGQHPGLARAGARHDQQRRPRVGHRGCLLRVEPRHERLGSVRRRGRPDVLAPGLGVRGRARDGRGHEPGQGGLRVRRAAGAVEVQGRASERGEEVSHGGPSLGVAPDATAGAAVVAPRPHPTRTLERDVGPISRSKVPMTPISRSKVSWAARDRTGSAGLGGWTAEVPRVPEVSQVPSAPVAARRAPGRRVPALPSHAAGRQRP
ncbi:conserved hypothetical protein [Micrococcus sp. 116]|nr:conserved hypothetical protein [Micrococcus sp. 116]